MNHAKYHDDQIRVLAPETSELASATQIRRLGERGSRFATHGNHIGCDLGSSHKSACRTKPIKALAPEDLGLLGSRNPRYGVELSILAPFMQQAVLYTRRAPADGRICRE